MLAVWIPLLVVAAILTTGAEDGPGSIPFPRNVQSTPGEQEPPSSVQPHPDLSPADVVRIQVAALGKNNAPHIDAGIETAFRFASPRNKRSTGPLARFRLIARSPTYRPLLDHVRADYGGVRKRGEEAAVPVIVTTPAGRRVGYTFVCVETDPPALPGLLDDRRSHPLPGSAKTFAAAPSYLTVRAAAAGFLSAQERRHS